MSRLSSIPIAVEGPRPDPSDRGNALPILQQIRFALRQLVESGETTVIDLRSIPFGPGDEERLLAALGQGEVAATVNALGPTRVVETAFPGVWLVDHRNTDDERLVLHVEITWVPEILRAQPDDVADGLAELEARSEAELHRAET
jgi:hydrogenase-1 operon protein HyaF